MSVQEFRIYADGRIRGMRDNRMSWWSHWSELATYILPRRYRWLVTANQWNRGSPINGAIIDSTGTLAARTLASGMHSGLTSPTRPWFKMKISGYENDHEVVVWLAECTRRMLEVFGASNFYTAMATMYFDLVVFGTACVIIYEDFDDIICCYTPCLGEFFFDVNAKNKIGAVGREFVMTYTQMIEMFGEENVSEDVRNAVRRDGTAKTQERVILHLIEPNTGKDYGVVSSKFPWREAYWEQGANTNQLLRARGYWDWPCMTPRWDVTGNDPYGRSDGMDALGDIKQLQQETRRKAQAIDKMVDPPMLADVMLKNQPASTLPGGVTYVAGLNQGRAGMAPVYTVDPKIAEMMQDIREIQNRIRITFHNDLFTGITDLQTVRTATEIDARREEKLVLLGPVLERILGEGLGKAIDRVWGIMWRGGLLPPPPETLRGRAQDIEVDYVSMLAQAQRSLITAPIEKLWGFAGTIAGVKPEVLLKLDPFDTIDQYAEAVGAPPKIVIPSEEAQETLDAQNAQMQAERAASLVTNVVDAGKTLSDTDVGGGINAAQLALGNVP